MDRIPRQIPERNQDATSSWWTLAPRESWRRRYEHETQRMLANRMITAGVAYGMSEAADESRWRKAKQRRELAA
jgi:hypothetical protein